VTAPPVLRAGRDEDAAGFIDLIAACWAEYPGCVMDLDGEVPELRALASYYAKLGGALWAAEADGRVVGMVGTRPLPRGEWEICKMYAYASQRGTGLAQALVAAAEGHARAQGATGMRLWSDTRFDRAHRFYEKCSYLRDGPIRALGDLSNSLEFEYAKPLTGTAIRRLDAASAVAAIPRLAEVLADCVAAGDALAFHAPLPLPRARALWKEAASRAAMGQSVLFAAWHEGVLAGTLTLALEQAETQCHRAELRDLLVAPTARRHGLGRMLLRAADAAARDAGREMLGLTVPEGSAAEALARAEGWTAAGTLPDAIRTTTGTVLGATTLWKRLPTA
jgi:GNAT superfamily N-acetyltransferase